MCVCWGGGGWIAKAYNFGTGGLNVELGADIYNTNRFSRMAAKDRPNRISNGSLNVWSTTLKTSWRHRFHPVRQKKQEKKRRKKSKVFIPNGWTVRPMRAPRWDWSKRIIIIMDISITPEVTRDGNCGVHSCSPSSSMAKWSVTWRVNHTLLVALRTSFVLLSRSLSVGR